MSNFTLLSADVSLWEVSTKATWGSFDFCPAVSWFQVHAITQAQLTALFQAGAWGNVEKPQWDMAFMLVAPSLTIRYKQIFGLMAMLAHPFQAHYHNLEEVAHKLVLLVDEGPDCPYASVQMNDTMTHVPLSSEGHIGTMTDGMPNMNACGHLHQLQVWMLLQSGSLVVCTEGLNEKLKALQFNFEELPLWNAATMGEPTQDPPLIEVDLSCTEPEDMMTTPQAPTTKLIPSLLPAAVIEPPHDIATAINLHLQGALEWLLWTSHNLDPCLLAQHARERAAIGSLGGSTFPQSRRPPWAGGIRFGHPWPNGNL